MKLDVSGVAADFPAFVVAGIVFRDITVPNGRPDGLEGEIAERQARAVEAWQGHELSQIPGIAAWRAAYRQFGVKKTSYRCSVERLVKNALAGRDVVQINGFVDAYNAVSLAHVFPLGADDLAKVKGDICFRYSCDGDSFLPLGREADGNDPPKPGEVVYADDEKVLCRRWNWYQDGRSPVTTATQNAVLTVQANGWGDLDAAVADVCALVQRFCGGTSDVAVASQDRPVVDLGGS